MCVGFKKVQSDDLQSPDSLCNTFTETGEEGGKPSPLFSPLIIPHYLHTAFEAEMSAWEQEVPGCCLPLARPGGNLQSLLLYPDLGMSSWGCSGYPPALCILLEANHITLSLVSPLGVSDFLSASVKLGWANLLAVKEDKNLRISQFLT